MNDQGISYFQATDSQNLPEWVASLDTSFIRAGGSLMIVSATGEVLVVRGYFPAETSSILETKGGITVVPNIEISEDEDGEVLTETEGVFAPKQLDLLQDAETAALATKTAALIDGASEEEAELAADDAYIDVISAARDEDTQVTVSRSNPVDPPDLKTHVFAPDMKEAVEFNLDIWQGNVDKSSPQVYQTRDDTSERRDPPVSHTSHKPEAVPIPVQAAEPDIEPEPGPEPDIEPEPDSVPKPEPEPVPEPPTLLVNDVSGAEDTLIPLDLSASLPEPESQRNLTIEISGVPEGASLSGGTDNGNGSWSLLPEDLADLSFTPVQDDASDISLAVTATATDPDTGDVSSASASLDVKVTGVADEPLLATADVAGAEDMAIGLDISAALSDTTGEILLVRISGVPQGATLSAGNDLGDGVWTLSVDHLTGLTFLPAENDSSDISLSVAVTALEEGTTSAKTEVFQVAVIGVADRPVLQTTNAQGMEDTEIALDISAALVDPSEVLGISVSDIPVGAVLQSGHDRFMATNKDDTADISDWNLDTLIITPAKDDDSNFTLAVSATSSETDGSDSAEISTKIDVTVEPFEYVGTDDADTISASGADDVIRGLGGDDAIDAAGGSDTVYAGNGDDSVLGRGGADLLYGEAGDDNLQGGSGADILYGGQGSDDLAGNAGNDEIYGDAGNDFISGGSGEDILYGGTGDDILEGGAKNDFLAGGAGADTLTGGKGNDIFHFDSMDDVGDTITDFKSGKDSLTFDADAFNANYDPDTGELDAGAFESLAEFDPGTPSSSAAFVFDQGSDNLYYDESGIGEGYTLVATVNDGDLDLSDILMID
jgi:Ca2+-binding RTX toxin-like protein